MPFLDEEDDYVINQEQNFLKSESNLKSFFSDKDKKFFIIGGTTAVAAFCLIAYFVYFGSKPIDLAELPIIQADPTPFKVKSSINEQVRHQDKTVYDNISGNKRDIVEKVILQPEETLSVPEKNAEDTISEEEKKNIVQAFDDLAPEKEYKIKYVNDNGKKTKTKSARVLATEEELIPVKKINAEQPEPLSKSKRTKAENITTQIASKSKGTIMVQIATVTTKAAAEAEYNRMLRKNKQLRNFGKKIFKIDLGKKKGIKYRVQVGPFKNKEEANKAIMLLKRNRFSAYIPK
ncbi:MAG: SPOR domain-containing protein [Holosporaceae bacterium]|jgi:cell division protein FtsN|nr:SPOR domain-containing protein [Holosporaceae bacterium]